MPAAARNHFVFGSFSPAFPAEERGRNDRPRSQRAAVLDRVAKFEDVVLRFVGHGVDARNRALTAGVDLDLVGCHLRGALHAVGGLLDARGVVDPCALGGEVVDDPLGQRDGRAARRILLLRVVRLADADLVAAYAADHGGQLAVEAEEQVDAQAVVRGVEEGPAPLPAERLHLGQALGPARRAAHHGRAVLEAGADVLARRGGRGEFDGHVGPGQVRGVELRAVVGIDDEDHLVAPLGEDLLDLAAHLAVTYNDCFHLVLVGNMSCKDNTS